MTTPYTFATPQPPRLCVELGRGSLHIVTDDVTETHVELRPHRDDDVSRRLVEETVVEQHGDDIVVRVPKRSRHWFGEAPALDISIRAPHDSALRLGSGSADIIATGRFGATDVGTGSGDVIVDHIVERARVRTGSGDVRIEAVDGDLDVRTGSGDVHVDVVAGAMAARTGSGDVALGDGGRSLSATTGSGNVTVSEAPEEIGVKTGSGDIRVGAVRHGVVSAIAASGDIHIGVVTSTAAWLDVRTVSGRVANGLDAADEPAAGDDRVRLELHTVSGDITLARAAARAGAHRDE